MKKIILLLLWSLLLAGCRKNVKQFPQLQEGSWKLILQEESSGEPAFTQEFISNGFSVYYTFNE